MKKLTTLVALALAVVAFPAQAQDAPPPANVAGNWDYAFDSPQGSHLWRIVIEQSADSIKGTASSELGTLVMVNPSIKGSDLSFGVSLNMDGQVIDLWFSGKVDGDSTVGTIDVPIADLALPFTGKRIKT
jgi:hypothetical protein